ncbi:MAG: DUF2344 domain-containing protein [Lachnospiraceae bacterium]|nr:DUF2344 domain-containing protein [Lachnospiraceae bacterium]
MVVRIKFSKYGFTKFLGHLDVMRYFQKAIRRSGLDVTYSAGFNPHQLLYFAAPLGLGQTSDGEYLDAEFNQEYTEAEILERLNATMSEGFMVQSVTRLKEWEPNTKKESIMSLTSCADYLLSIKDMPVTENGVEQPYAAYFAEFQTKLTEFLNKEQILVEKEGKKGTTEIDIKPMIFKYGFVAADINPEAEQPEAGIQNAEQYENGLRIFFKLASGSVSNLKPEVIFAAFCKEYGLPYYDRALQVHRMETYCDLSLRNLNQEQAKTAIAEGRRRQEFVPLYQVR